MSTKKLSAFEVAMKHLNCLEDWKVEKEDWIFKLSTDDWDFEISEEAFNVLEECTYPERVGQRWEWQWEHACEVLKIWNRYLWRTWHYSSWNWTEWNENEEYFPHPIEEFTTKKLTQSDVDKIFKSVIDEQISWAKEHWFEVKQ